MSVTNYLLLRNVHLELKPPTDDGETLLTQENYDYFHYNCDSVQDQGKK